VATGSGGADHQLTPSSSGNGLNQSEIAIIAARSRS
jgi:hypothetical protein